LVPKNPLLAFACIDFAFFTSYFLLQDGEFRTRDKQFNGNWAETMHRIGIETKYLTVTHSLSQSTFSQCQWG